MGERRGPDGTSSPMDGWSVSGVIAPGHDEDLLVRRLGGTEAWPDPELHQGVAGVQLRTWADDTSGGYLTVWGPDKDACVARWRTVAAALDFEAMWSDG